jgi:transforming growth factor-beta-induced protein
MFSTKHSLYSAIGLSLTLAMGACGDDEDSTEIPTPAEVSDAGSTPTDAGSASSEKDASTSSADAGTGSSDAGSSDTGKSDAAVSTASKTITELVVEGDQFSVLESAVITAQLADTLSGPGPYTVFAPTDAAFTAALKELGLEASALTKELLTPILTYHVVGAEVMSADIVTGPVKTVSGLSAWVDKSTGVTVNGSKVTTADIKAKNGVIHVIDKVILPPTLVQFATYAGFKSLTGAVTSAGLVETLSGDTKYTVFAPTDAAFAKLSAVPTGDALKNVLLYHVVPGSVLSTDLKAGSVATALTGQSLTIALPASGPTVNGAKVGPADLVVKNGVIHVVDTVLVPPTN